MSLFLLVWAWLTYFLLSFLTFFFLSGTLYPHSFIPTPPPIPYSSFQPWPHFLICLSASICRILSLVMPTWRRGPTGCLSSTKAQRTPTSLQKNGIKSEKEIRLQTWRWNVSTCVCSHKWALRPGPLECGSKNLRTLLQAQLFCWSWAKGLINFKNQLAKDHVDVSSHQNGTKRLTWAPSPTFSRHTNMKKTPPLK